MKARHEKVKRVGALCLALIAIAAAPVQAGTRSNVTSESAIGQLAAQASNTVIGFTEEAIDVALRGGDALSLPRGNGALARLAAHLPMNQLVVAGQSAFNGRGYDALLVTGTEIADRALRLAERPSDLRLQGATRTIRGMGPNGVFSGRGFSIGATATRPLSDNLVTAATVTIEESRITSNGKRDALFSHGWSAAAAVGWRTAPDLLVSFTAGGALIDRDLIRNDGAATASPSAQRGFVSLHAEHSLESNGFRLSPHATLNFTTELQNAYTDSTGAGFDNRLVHYGRLTAGLEAGYRWTVDRGALEVYSNLAGDWDFVRAGSVTLTSMRWNDDMPARASVASGVTLTSPGGLRSGLEVRNDAIGPEGLNQTTLQASVTLSF